MKKLIVAVVLATFCLCVPIFASESGTKPPATELAIASGALVPVSAQIKIRVGSGRRHRRGAWHNRRYRRYRRIRRG